MDIERNVDMERGMDIEKNTDIEKQPDLNRNRHRLGAVILTLFLLACACGMTALYPYIGKRANDYYEQVEGGGSQQKEEARAFAIEVVNSNYALWNELQQEQAGKALSYTEIFLENEGTAAAAGSTAAVAAAGSSGEVSEDAADVDTQELQAARAEINDFLTRRASIWTSKFGEIKDGLKVDVAGPDGTVLKAYEGSEFLSAADNVRVRLRYDAMGRMVVEDVNCGLAEYNEGASRAFTDQLNQYSLNDPLKELGLAEEFAFSSSGKQALPVFAGPKEVSFLYTLNSDLIFQKRTPNMWRLADYCLSSGVLPVCVGIFAVLILLAALFLPAVKTLGIGEGKVFEMPVEIVAAVATMCVALLVSPFVSAIIMATVNGQLYQELLQANLIPPLASFLTALLNVGAWFVGFALMFWGFVCLRGIYTIGPLRYLKERTFLGILSVMVWNLGKGLVAAASKINPEENTTKQILKIAGVNFLLLALIWLFPAGKFLLLLLYSAGLVWYLHRTAEKLQSNYRAVLTLMDSMSRGSLNLDMTTDLGVMEPVKQRLASIQDGYKKAVELEVASQRMKTELVTNVSHDLKTPLTAIITYVNLLKEENLTREDQKKYIEVLESKSLRLKALIEDLFEVSKANSGNVKLNLEEVDLASLIRGIAIEQDDRIQAAGLDLRFKLPEGKVLLQLDSEKTYRAIDNLIVNITKYALPGSRAYIEIKEVADAVLVSFKNISANEITVSPEELLDRFVQGDKSRSTEGSGLGLAIAKSFVELEGGMLHVRVDGDLFAVELRFAR